MFQSLILTVALSRSPFPHSHRTQAKGNAEQYHEAAALRDDNPRIGTAVPRSPARTLHRHLAQGPSTRQP